MEPNQQRHVVDEVYGFIKVFNDGSVERPTFPGGLSPSSPTHFVGGVASRDVTIDPTTGIWARVFLPKPLPPSHDNGIARKKIPLVLHFHGGGLCSGSPNATAFHTFCSLMATKSQSIWFSVDYRLAPEHRLPSAYNDAFSALMWIHAQSTLQKSYSQSSAQLVHNNTHDVQNRPHGHDTLDRLDELCGDYVHLPKNADPWLFHYADFNNLFFAGESSGGAIVHYLTMRILKQNLTPIRIRGLLIIHGAFLIKSEFDRSFDPSMERRPDTYRRLMLPEGAEIDDPLVDPLHPQAPPLKDIHLPPLIIVVAQLDKLCKPTRYYANVLKQYGHDVDVHFTEGRGHCFYLRNPFLPESHRLFEDLITFIHAHCVPQEGGSSL